jgi:hypothetical protein
MAVDANVLIYERIREELNSGKTILASIQAGFSRAWGTIIDSHLTALIAAIALFWLGSGPIRGFAVTLAIGIIATLFTAYLVTRLIVSIWVRVARPNEPVRAISGDGGFHMNMAEIATMIQEGLEVKLAVFNNGYLGMVRQWQQFFHGGRYSNTPIWSPDYVKLAAAYGIPGYRVKQAGEVRDALCQANEKAGPALVELVIEQEANVFPMIVPGGSLSEPLEAAPV